MPTITCPHCGLRLHLPPQHAQRALACPLCNAALGGVRAAPVPTASAVAHESDVGRRLVRYAGFAFSVLLFAGAVALLVFALRRGPGQPPRVPKSSGQPP